MNLSEPVLQNAVLRYRTIMAPSIIRASRATRQGEAGKNAIVEELYAVQVLSHFLVQRLTERLEALEATDAEADETPDPDPNEEAPPCP